MKIDSRRPAKISIAVILAGLVILSLVVRIPYFEVFGNTDEAWYAAAAAYHNTHDASPFGSADSGMAYMIKLYQYSALIGGNYSKSFVDFVTLVISIIITCGVFWMIYFRHGVLAALTASVLFMLVNPGFGGLTSNREWFSVIFIFVAVLLLRTWPFLNYRDFKHRVMYCGILVAFAFVMKSQAIPFLALVPALAFLWMVKCKTKKFDTFRILLWYMLALLLGFCVALTPYFLHGTAGFYFEDLFTGLFTYGVQNTAQESSNWISGIKILIGYSWINTNATSIFVGLASISCVYQFILIHQSFKTQSVNANIGLSSTLSIAFLLSMVCVVGGSRYFAHYYLFMLPFGIPLIIITIGSLSGRRDRTALLYKMFILVTVFFHAIWSAMRGIEYQYASLLTLFTTVIIVSAIYFSRIDKTSKWSFQSACSIYLMVFGFIVFYTYHEFVPSKSSTQKNMQNIVSAIDGIKHPTDKLFVWGWKPRLYVATGLVPATQFVSVANVVQDLNKTSGPEDKSPAMQNLIQQLEINQPKFLVDASRQSITMSTRLIYSLSHYDQVQSFISEHYDLEGIYDDYFLYVHH